MTEASVPFAPPLARLLAGRPALLRAPVVLTGVAALALASRAEFALGPVPITLQTYALFTLAGLAGLRLTFEIVLVWLLAAILGLPVLAGGAGGLEALTGHTAGYLAGMLIAGPLTGRTAERTRDALRLSLAFLLGHAVVLTLGWAWLAAAVGVGAAFLQGVAPFLAGALIKSVAAVATVKLVTWKAR